MQYNIKVDILRPTLSDDDLGGSVLRDVLLHRNLPGRINWLRGNDRIMFNKDTWVRDAKLFCHVVDIKVGDKVSFNNDVLDVVSVANPDSLNRFMVLDLKYVQK